MAHRGKRSRVERYHDRVARSYDGMYEGDRYWDLYREITWNHLKRYLPRHPGATGLDAGCGTGLWGLRLARCGLHVTLLDISETMLDVARDKARSQGLEGRCSFVKGDVATLDGVADGSVDLLTAQGDPLSCVEHPERAVAAIHRVLVPGGVAVVSVDGLFGGAFFFLERDDVDGLASFLASGRSQWQTDARNERFPTVAFSAARLRGMFERAGFETQSLIGKPVLPLRRFRRLLDDRATYARILSLEMRYGAEPELMGGAAHLEIAARKPSPTAS